MVLEILVNDKSSCARKVVNAGVCSAHRGRIVDQYSNAYCGAITNTDKNGLFLIRTTADGTIPMRSLKSEGPFSTSPQSPPPTAHQAGMPVGDFLLLLTQKIVPL